MNRNNVNFPKVICFCGSTRFTIQMLIIKWEFEKLGRIVLTWNYLPESYEKNGPNIAEAENVKELIDEIHKRKIDLCDEVFVINIDGYIGESTRSEIDYALENNIPIKYYE